MLFEENVLTVSQLNGFIREVLNMGFPQPVWICGEVQGYNRSKDKNHVFFELCEKDPSSQQIVARVGLVLFSGRKSYIENILKSAENAFELKDDIEVKFLCRVDFYPPHGAVRLVVESIDPTYTLGKIAQERQKLIAELKKSGLLEANKKNPLPVVPLSIGLITSGDSAAYNDFISELQLSGFAFKVYLCDTLMQGKKAPSDVARSLKVLGRFENLDVIVITRGGGSIADLSCFDSKLIAETIALANVPILSGIGHEVNITITDLVAHTYQKTPTAIAQFLIKQVEQFLAEAEARLEDLVSLSEDLVSRQKGRLTDLARNLQKTTTAFLKDHSFYLLKTTETLRTLPLRLSLKASDDLAVKKQKLFDGAQQYLKVAREQLIYLERLTAVADPAHVIQRGFSLTRNAAGQVVRSVSDIKKGEFIRTQVRDGSIESVVSGKEMHDA